MGKFSLTCCSPSLLRETLSCSNNVDDEAIVSFASLITDLEKLQKSLAENSKSLQWCKEAMVLLKKLHSEFLLLFEKFKVSISWDGVNDLLDEYMKETLNILDLCNLLKSTIFKIDRYGLMVDFAAKFLRDSVSLSSPSKAEIERLEKESKKLYGVENLKDVNLFKAGMSKTKCKDSAVHVIYAVKIAMTIISMLICSVIICPIPIKIDKGGYCGFPQMKPFLNSVQNIIDYFEKKFQNAGDNTRLALKENAMIEKAIVEIKAQLIKGITADKENFVTTIELLKQRSVVLKEGLQVLESEVNQVFEEVVKGRNQRKFDNVITTAGGIPTPTSPLSTNTTSLPPAASPPPPASLPPPSNSTPLATSPPLAVSPPLPVLSAMFSDEMLVSGGIKSFFSEISTWFSSGGERFCGVWRWVCGEMKGRTGVEEK
ncbi:hypothetical protein F0562_028192 [Nyssa sinensis]|uniref:Uncharacterized protein n=1 Tax=Nyssa sinensis TaxID=561372 RepID=A0A5J5B7Q1_9ASTE|nr:hypothetical protein F0562_028192 [Nyssa sinensis]